MSSVDIDVLSSNKNSAKTHSFSSEPISVLNFVDVAIHRPLVEKAVQNLIPRKNAES